MRTEKCIAQCQLLGRKFTYRHYSTPLSEWGLGRNKCLQFVRQRYRFFNNEVSEDASKYVHCQRTFSSILIHISHFVTRTRNLSFWNPKHQSKTLSNSSSLVSRKSVKDNRHQTLNWRFHKARWRFEVTETYKLWAILPLLATGFLRPVWYMALNYMHLAVQRALVSCLLFYC